MPRLVVTLLVLGLASCGGSSSETPFPLEPDLSRLDGGTRDEPRRVVHGGTRPAARPAASGAEPAEPEGPRK